ncbi:MAG: DUF2497 domain-containing protein [Holosporaceae bacterium]|jgi:cell pole-organizing protein PopZ|nr:DUF2497 domain-containing protein [Holosporaceae bacterium]
MIDKDSEMSLDDVLSSIKKMIINDEPPVLELTDVVKPDGSIVKIETTNSKNSSIGSFLKLVQESTSFCEENEHLKEKYISQQLQKAPVIATDVLSCPVSSQDKKLDESKKADDSNKDKREAISNTLKEIIDPMVDKWLEENLASLVNKKIEENQMIKQWMNDNLSEITKNAVEKVIRELLTKI